MSISMKSLLTEFKDDNSHFWQWNENYINHDHTMINYTAGTGGEWFCHFLAQHEDLKYFNTAMQGQKVNNNNRWRIKGSCIGNLSNAHRDSYYNTDQHWNYDGSADWYRTAINNGIEFGKQINFREKLRSGVTNQTITRSHEAWQECHMWPQQFKSFKVITLTNTKEQDTWNQFCSNIIKKIWLHEYDWHEYMDEFSRKTKGKLHTEADEQKAVAVLKKLGEPYQWYKLQFAVFTVMTNFKWDEVYKCMIDKWESETADWKLKNYTVPLPVNELKIDLLAMLRDKRYKDIYKSICEFLNIHPMKYSQWEKAVDDYFFDDKQNIIDESELKNMIGDLVEHAKTLQFN